MSSQLSLLVIRCRDVEATRDFYAALGLHFEPEQHGSGPLHYAAQIGEVVLEIYPYKNGQNVADETTMLGFQVASLEETITSLGVDVQIKSSDWGRFCNVKDPDDRTVRFTETS